jgi:peroxiredoxin Q/BCP
MRVLCERAEKISKNCRRKAKQNVKETCCVEKETLNTMSTLKKGDKAPDFSSEDQNGKKVSLADYRGKKLVLYFYPKDDTPGCTAQACNLRDHHDALIKKGYHILGVSPDSGKSHLKFIAKYNLPFDLLSDTDHSLAQQFGVYGLKKFMGREYMGINRTTFLIDENGVINEVISKVDTKAHAAQIL